MSWIVRDLWQSLEKRRGDYETLLRERGEFHVFEAVNLTAAEVGSRWGVLLQLNFPPGRKATDFSILGHRDLSILVYRDRKRFENVASNELQDAFRRLGSLGFDSTGFGYEGFRVGLATGRIDCLPGGVHLWTEITPRVLMFLDWLFIHEYGLKPPESSA